jgi:hypothetical protein
MAKAMRSRSHRRVPHINPWNPEVLSAGTGSLSGSGATSRPAPPPDARRTCTPRGDLPDCPGRLVPLVRLAGTADL